MQTNFTLAQLADPDVVESNDILRACVHCGFCTATCPTYVVLGDELDSPRGRIYLMKNMLESGAPADVTTVKHLDRCLTCLSCMTTCPSSVHYMHLVDHARAHVSRTFRRPLIEELTRLLLNAILPYTRRFRMALLLARFGKPFSAVLPSAWRSVLRMIPQAPPARAPAPSRPADHVGTRRVALLDGCVQPVLRPQINAAATRLLNRRGVEVIIAPKSGCCGALSHHLSKDQTALALARANIDAWTAEIDRGLDAIIVTASGCGTMIKDYGHLFRNDTAYAAKAARISAHTRDITEYLAQVGLGEVTGAPALTIAYHSACSMQHGQKIDAEPRKLLRQCGFAVREIAEAHLCCGSAGIYNLLQPEIAGALLERKAANIQRIGAALVATGNIGCITQLQQKNLPVMHTVELLDWATGGPEPSELSSAS